MYYIGTLEQCEAYNAQVVESENYQGTTTQWAEVIKHPEQDLYAIEKHPEYNADMQTMGELTIDWFPQMGEE